MSIIDQLVWDVKTVIAEPAGGGGQGRFEISACGRVGGQIIDFLQSRRLAGRHGRARNTNAKAADPNGADGLDLIRTVLLEARLQGSAALATEAVAGRVRGAALRTDASGRLLLDGRTLNCRLRLRAGRRCLRYLLRLVVVFARFAELTNALAYRATNLRQTANAKDDDHDGQDYDQLEGPHGADSGERSQA
jgi:hypothetical protein